MRQELAAAACAASAADPPRQRRRPVLTFLPLAMLSGCGRQRRYRVEDKVPLYFEKNQQHSCFVLCQKTEPT